MLDVREVTGSSPVSSTIKQKHPFGVLLFYGFRGDFIWAVFLFFLTKAPTAAIIYCNGIDGEQYPVSDAERGRGW